MNEPMTPEAKAMVMQLMGQTYGQVKRQDEMIVGKSAQLNSKSGEMRQLFEQVAQLPTSSSPAPGQPAPGQPDPQAAAPARAPVEAPPVAPAPVNATSTVEEQGMFDFSEPSGIDKLIELQKETNLLLKAIKLQLENSNVRPKRKSAVKEAKSSVA